MKKTSTNNNSFSEKHPVANFVLGCQVEILKIAVSLYHLLLLNYVVHIWILLL